MVCSKNHVFSTDYGLCDVPPTLPNGKQTSVPARSTTGVAIATKGTDIACGGSGAVGIGKAVGSAGCDGAVFVMGIR